MSVVEGNVLTALEQLHNSPAGDGSPDGSPSSIAVALLAWLEVRCMHAVLQVLSPQCSMLVSVRSSRVHLCMLCVCVCMDLCS